MHVYTCIGIVCETLLDDRWTEVELGRRWLVSWLNSLFLESLV